MRPIGHTMSARRPSRAWAATTMITSVVALALIVFATIHQREADRPVGEGEVFLEDASYAASRVTNTMTGGMLADPAIRHVRNELTVEAISIVGPDGITYSSTSDTLAGMPLTNGLLSFGHFDRRFVAIAAPINTGIEVDDVTEWLPGDVLYQALHPLEDGSSLLMFYDMDELLERRALLRGVQPLTVQLLGAALLLAVVSALFAFGRSRAWRRYEQFELESSFLRERSADLERHNQRLDEALALAQETNRVRAEFVLMINHELRTPLTGVVTGAELLASDQRMTKDDRSRLLADMVTDGRRLQEMIAQMLAVARVENRGLNFELADIVASELCSEIERKHPRIRHEHDGVDLSRVMVHTDSATMAQVAGSLADNAYTHGAEDVWIQVAETLPFEPMHRIGDCAEPGVYLMVCDDGPGIDLEFLPRAFEKFEKMSRSSGTGLGLYLVQVMIDALGACLSVKTGPEGTVMAIGMPATLASAMARSGSWAS